MQFKIEERKIALILMICCTAQSEGAIGHSYISDKSAYWSNGRVDYVFEERFGDVWKDNIRDAIDVLKNNLTKDCLEFRELESIPYSPPYLLFIHSECKATIGMQTDDATKVYIGPHCHSEDLIIHEIMHALGAVHEHTRPDRDVFVSINFTNIHDEQIGDFNNTMKADKTYGTAFDYNSIMLYPDYAAAKDPKYPTMIPKLMRGSSILKESNYEMSPTDVVELSRAYGCRVDPITQIKYNAYLDRLLITVLDAFSTCIDKSSNPVGSCQSYLPVSESMLDESRSVSTLAAYAFHNIRYNQVLDKLRQRVMMKNMYSKIKSKTIVSLLKLEKRIVSLVSKPWFGKPGIEAYKGQGYEVIEAKHPWCGDRFPGGEGASVHSQADLDFIKDLVGYRAAWLGGKVDMSRGPRPSYAKFEWYDGSTTAYFRTLNKKFSDMGAAMYYVYIKLGKLRFGYSKHPEYMVCQYP